MKINFLKIALASSIATATLCANNQQYNMTSYNHNNINFNTENQMYKLDQNNRINTTIVQLANKLFNSSRINQYDISTIAITSFVDINQLNKTSKFGRTLSEGFFDELFTRGFNVSDFRGQNSLSVNAEGEYFITRDIKKLNKNINNRYILVGTYSVLNESVLLNARIIDNQSGRIVASARSTYYSNDCALLENCKKPRRMAIVNHNLKGKEYRSSLLGNTQINSSYNSEPLNKFKNNHNNRLTVSLIK